MCAVDHLQAVLLTLLDLDLASHEILLKRMKSEFGVCGSALDWMQSYLSGSSQSMVIDGLTFNARLLGCGLSQV